MTGPVSGVTRTSRRPARRVSARRASGAVVACGIALGAGACSRPPRRAAEVLPNHSWRTAKGDGPTYTFRPGQQAELLRGTTILSGTYEIPTDSALVLHVSGLIPGMPTPGPTTLMLRFDVRVLPDAGGHERVEFRAGTGADTLARGD